ncbi:MAG: glycosyltransferase family 39 protein [Gaiellaceae bacterium]
MNAPARAQRLERSVRLRVAAERTLPFAAFFAVVAAAAFIVAAQPVNSPWWTYAEADAVYVSQGLDLLRGTPVRYFDHPGLPVSELAAVSFAADYARVRVSGSSMTRAQYVDDRLLNLDKTRGIFRGLGIAIYLLGTALVFILLARLFGGWFWGLSGAILWLAAPGLWVTSIMFKPDVAFSIAVLGVACLLGRAVEDRSPLRYAAAAAVAGFAVMLKLHAVGLLVPIVVAVVWRPPPADWWTHVKSAPKHLPDLLKRWCAVPALLLFAAAIAFGLFIDATLPHALTRQEKVIVFEYIAIVLILLALGVAAERLNAPAPVRRVLSPFAAFVGAAFLVGLAVPALLDFPDWLHALVAIRDALTGHGVNSGVGAFNSTVDFHNAQMNRALLIFGVALVAAAVGVARRDPRPVVWCTGAIALDVMAFARQGYIHYFAPGFVCAVPAVLWLATRLPARAGVAATAVLVTIVAAPTYHLRSWSTDTNAAQRKAVDPSIAEITRRLRPNEAALTAYYWPEADNRWFNDVAFYSNYVPEYPYRFLPAWSAAMPALEHRRLTPAYYTGPEIPSLHGTTKLTIWDIGSVTLEPLPGYPYAAKIVSAPGLAH